MSSGCLRFRENGRLASAMPWIISNPAEGCVKFAATGEVACIDASCYRQSFNAAAAVFVLRSWVV